MSDTSRLVLGPEWDRQLRRALAKALENLGAQQLGHVRALGAPQEIEQLLVTLQGETILVEAETYIGLSIEGSPSLLERIQREVISLTVNESPE